MSSHNARAVVVTFTTRQTTYERDLGKPAPLIGSWEEEFLLKDYTTPWAFLNAIAQVFIGAGIPFTTDLYTVRNIHDPSRRTVETTIMGFTNTDPEIARIICAITNAELFSHK